MTFRQSRTCLSPKSLFGLGAVMAAKRQAKRKSIRQGGHLVNFPDWYPDWLQEAAAQLAEKYGRLGTEFRWDEWPQTSYDLKAGTLTFWKDGVPRLVGEIQVVGTSSEKAGNWLWAWGNSAWPDSCVGDVLRVHQFGEKHEIEELTERCLPGNENLEGFAWSMTAAAVRVVDAMGAYRLQREDDGGGCFLLIKSMDWVQPETQPKAGWTLSGWMKRLKG
jgi:hypothetical protein